MAKFDDFLRALYLKTEANFYTADAKNNTHHDLETVPSLKELIASNEQERIISALLAAYNEQCLDLDQAIHMLAFFCRLDNVKLTTLSYEAFSQICGSTKNLFYFVNMCKKLHGSNLSTGRGIRSVIKKWYTSKSPEELMIEVTKVRGQYTWKHADLLRLAHVKPISAEQEIIFTYLLFNLDKAKLLGEEDSDSQSDTKSKIFSYLEAVEEVKHSKDFHTIGALFERHKLCIEHIPNEMLKAENIWKDILPHLPFEAVLNNLSKMSRLGLFSNDNELKDLTIKLLLDEKLILNSGLFPEEIFLKMKEYAAHDSHPKYGRKRGREPSVDLDILNCLPQILKTSSKIYKTIGKKICIILESSHKSQPPKCHNLAITYNDIINFLIFRVVASESEVDVVYKSAKCYKSVIFTKRNSFNDIKQALSKETFNVCDYPSVVDFVMEKQLSPDVLIHIQPHFKRNSIELLRKSFTDYKHKSNKQGARFIIISALDYEDNAISVNVEGVLPIFGFDLRVPRIMEAFARGFF